MDRQDFLDFGITLNKVDNPFELELLVKRVQGWPEDEERAFLLYAAELKHRNRLSLCSRECKEALLPLSKLWCSLDERARRNLQDVLAGTMEIDRLTHQAKPSAKFYDWLKVYADTDKPIAVIKAFLCVQEATEQFLWDTEGRQRPPAKWSTLQSIRTIWATSN
jgi:hypothetical protein